MAWRVARARERPWLARGRRRSCRRWPPRAVPAPARAAALEALVDGVLLEAGQQAGELRGAAGADGHQGGDDGHHDARRRWPCAGARPSLSPPGARGGCCPARTTTVRPAMQVADGDAAARDARQRPVAAVGDEPGRPAHGDDAVARARAEAGRGCRGPTASAAGARRATAAARAPPAGHVAGAPRSTSSVMPWPPAGWRTSKRPPWKVPVWVAASGQRGLQLHAAGARVDDRADRNRGAVGERRRVGGARHAHQDAAVRRRDGHAAPEDGGRGGRGRELGPRQRRRRGGGRQAALPTLPRRGERRERHVVAVA